MSEGEIKKRLDKYADEEYDELGDIRGTVEFVENVLDEVAKELLAILNNGDSDEDRLSELSVAIKKWFVKSE